MGLIAPTLPTSGEDRGTEEVDVINAIQTIIDAINGGLDAANVAAAMFAAYKPVHSTVGGLTSADGTTSKIFNADGTPIAAAAALSSTPPMLIVPSSNPWLLSGKTPKMRISGMAACNNVAPGGGLLTLSLKPITFSGTGGNITASFGATVASATMTPAQASTVTGASADFDVPAAGVYAIIAQMGTALSANVVVSINASVELRHV